MITPVLDHLVLDVHADMDAAAALYRQLGFTLTERGHHTLGSINHLAMFGTDYLELLGWPETGTSRTELLSFPRGLNGLVFKTDDADATFAHLQAAGLAADPPRAFSRPVAIGGETRDAKFRTVHVAADKARLGRIYFCEHLTPELVWRPEWQLHPNGATSIDAVVVASADPDAMAALFRVMFGDTARRLEDGRLVLSVGRPRLEILPAATLGPDGAKPAGRADFMATLRLAGREGAAIAAADAGNIKLEFVG
jgi:hypothetical protein